MATIAPDTVSDLTAARAVARRLNDSVDELRDILPVTGTELAYMPEKFRTEADALLHRFVVLHALLAGRVLPAVLRAVGVEARGKSLAEVAPLLASLGVVADPEMVTAVTDIRTRIAEAYPTDPADEAELLNAAARAVPTLLALSEKAAARLGYRT